tara:strand:+ start:1317 stop:1571 length:255 start_codon:yes stop_codon:yes gene_type:complete
MVEQLDIRNVIEVDRIREILVKHPDLMSMFELVCIVCNERLNNNTEKKISTIDSDLEAEDNIEPDLSDHESDEEDLTMTELLNL